MNTTRNETLQKQLTYSALEQYDKKLVDHNVAQGSFDGLIHYHQGILTDVALGAVKENSEVDRTIHKAESELSLRIGETIRRYVPNAKNVLDVGCGKMGTAVQCLTSLPEAVVTGIDISATSIAWAKNLPAIKKNADNFNAIRGDYNKTDFSDQSFQAIYAMESLQFCASLPALFKKWRKMLSDRGIVVISQMTANELSSFKDIALTTSRVNTLHQSIIHTSLELTEALKASQFEVMCIRDFTHDVINYWRLRQRWGFKTFVDPSILEGYCSGTLNYFMMVAKPREPVLL